MFFLSDELRAAREYEARECSAISARERPAIHLTPPVGWLNDPNGFCRYHGAYHLFFQYHPYSTEWGPMHWGHAVSNDFLQWEYRPCALAPDSPADRGGCFSGSALPLSDGRLMLFYTGVLPSQAGRRPLQVQCAAVGNGTDFEKTAQNPLMDSRCLPDGFAPEDFRDPKIWRENGRFYCAAVALHLRDQGCVLLFESDDALRWNFVRILDASRGDLGLVWECPDLFPLGPAHVLLVSAQKICAPPVPGLQPGCGSFALIGKYDDETHVFTRQHVYPADCGPEFYAPQTVLTPDGRRVMVAWMQNWETCGAAQRAHRWFGCMSLPRELTLRDGKLYQAPVREIEALWRGEVRLCDLCVNGTADLTRLGGRRLDLTITLDTSRSTCRTLTLRFAQNRQFFTEVRCELDRGELIFDRSRCGTCSGTSNIRRIPAEPRSGKLTLRLILDGMCAELFINDGEQAFSALLDTPPDADGLSLQTDGPATLTVMRRTFSTHSS